MLRHKNIERVCCVVLALTLLVSGLFVGAATGGFLKGEASVGYENRLFDRSRVHTVDIVMNDWEGFVSTASSEEYSACSIVIDGESYKNVAIRAKGNTSLSSVAAYGNNRYSFKVEFDQYQNGMTYHGLDKLSLNNLIQDNTYMKDYLAYTLMGKMGVAAPLCSFVQINVNGEPWGLYLAVEGVEDSFLQRNYGKDHGELYKPDSLSFGGGRGNGDDFDMGDFMKDFDFSSMEGEWHNFGMLEMPEGLGSFDPSQMGGFDFTQFMGGVQPQKTEAPEATAAPDTAAGASMNGIPNMGGMPDMGNLPAGFDPSQMGGMPDRGNLPAGFDTSQKGGMPDMGNLPAGFDPSMMGGFDRQPAATETPEATAAPDADAGVTKMPDMNGRTDRGNRPEGFEPSQMGGFGGMSSSDVKLQYSDDDPASYPNIFNNAKTEITEADKARLIASLKALGEGDTSVVDTDAVLRYMAVHNFLCNDDSYTGMMVHNYYLYEEDGVMAMIPWDYNLAYGGFTGGNATSTVNTGIDSLVSMGGSGDRPMASWITASEESLSAYHRIYREFIDTVFASGWFAEEIDRVTAMIDPYVQNDPTSFCTYEAFQNAAQILKSFCHKRAESVVNQLNGDNTRVDASNLDLSAMGTMNGMGGFGGGDRGGKPFGGRRGEGEKPAEENAGEKNGFSMPFDRMGGMQSKTGSRESLILLAVCAVLLAGACAAVKCYPNKR